ncbi:hypothetical protein YC2023_026832 [Brassica napus]
MMEQGEIEREHGRRDRERHEHNCFYLAMFFPYLLVMYNMYLNLEFTLQKTCKLNNTALKRKPKSLFVLQILILFWSDCLFVSVSYGWTHYEGDLEFNREESTIGPLSPILVLQKAYNRVFFLTEAKKSALNKLHTFLILLLAVVDGTNQYGCRKRDRSSVLSGTEPVPGRNRDAERYLWRSVADFEKSDPCLAMNPPQWKQPSFALPA